MSKTEHAPETQATKFLKSHKIPFSSHLYAYEEHGGTKVSARELNVAEHAVVKTLIFEDENAKPLIVLMHGDCKVSTKELARQIGVKKVGRKSPTATAAISLAAPAPSAPKSRCRSTWKKPSLICR